MASDAADGLAVPLFEATVARLERLTAISSPSGDLAGLDRMADALGTELGARGFEVSIERPDGRLPLLHARRGECPAPLLLAGHLDTVLPARAPQRVGDHLLATGAIDMKGGFATLLGALDLLAARGAEPPPLALVAVPDEEVGGEISRRAIAEQGARARALWVLEPGEARAAGETLVIGRRGMLSWTLEARGRAAHSGLAYWEGRSALAAAAEWAVAATALSEPGRGPTVNAARLVAGDAGFVDALAANADLLRSGRQVNVVPDAAAVEGEIRFLARADAERVDRSLAAAAAEIAARRGVGLDYRSFGEIPAVEPTAAGRATARTAVEAARARGWRLELEEERGGISFPNFLPDPAALPVLDGLGPVGGGMHTRGEWVDLASLARRIVLLADLLEREARRAPGEAGASA